MKKLFVLPGYCVGLGGLLLITYRTLLAVGSESKAITVSVNRFGEQYLDLVCLVFLWVVCLVGLLSLSSMVVQKKSKGGSSTARSREGDGMISASSFGVSDSFLGQPSVAKVGTYGLVRSTDSMDFSVDENGRSSVSVSVVVQQEGSQG